MERERTKPDEEMGLQKELAFHAPPPALSFPGTRSKPAQQRTTLRDKPLKPADQQGRSSNVLSSREQASIYGLVFRVPLVAQQQKQASCQQHECWGT